MPGLRHNGHASYGKRKFFWKPAMGNLIEDLSYAWPFKFTLTEIQSAAGHLMLKELINLTKIELIEQKNLLIVLNLKMI